MRVRVRASARADLFDFDQFDLSVPAGGEIVTYVGAK